MAFVEEENPDGFALADEHLSSNFGWAQKDIRRTSHMEVFAGLFPQGFDIVDVGEFPRDDHDQVIAALKRCKTAQASDAHKAQEGGAK